MRPIPIFALALAAACASGSLRSFFLHSIADEGHLTLPELFEESRRSRVNAAATSALLANLDVTIVPLDASTYSVSIDLRSGPKSAQLPWAIRPGPCGDMTPNSEIGGRGPYSAISTQADGSAHVNTRVRVEIPDGALHVDVMQSNSQRDVVLSCGPLAPR